jgi:Uma2 family endonuclease
MVMPLSERRNYTIDDIYELPDGQRAELIHGQMYDMAPPSRIHQKLVMNLAGEIRNYIKQSGGSCEVYPAPFAVFLQNEDELNYVEPDISVICDKEKLDEKGCMGAPDFIIEVVSPSSRKMDYFTKNLAYLNAGVREYWIVDPQKEITTIYRFEEEDVAPVVVMFPYDIPVGIYGNLQLNISQLLADE